ncbi:hypothetical protein GCM10009799_34160 [Nocardiopsis rhodophaea]|uniref:Uncharacterized protein n=1 Tax=Nocardiopsis rhodophaea TaxID=280238 RepID=A0ABP5EPD1_9ACTN
MVGAPTAPKPNPMTNAARADHASPLPPPICVRTNAPTSANTAPPRTKLRAKAERQERER